MQFFVTGTDTNVGKTAVSAALLSLMVKAGQRPFAFKPYESGMDASDSPSDSLALHHAAGGWQSLETISLHRFREPLAPGIAARLERRKPSWAATLNAFKKLKSGPGVIEGAGGLHVPLDEQHDVIDLIEALKVPVVLVARAGLGTINHTTLSVNALLQRKVKIAAVVLSQATGVTDVSMPHNAPELSRRFPKLRIMGPVAFIFRPDWRLQAFENALQPIFRKSS